VAFENGVNWQPKSPHLRGRHKTFSSALDVALKDLLVEKNPFYDSVVAEWPRLFPSCPAWPGRSETGKIVLYVRNPPALYAMRMKLPAVRAALLALEGAPKRLELRLEIHSA
jgi:hypothetical protein